MTRDIIGETPELWGTGYSTDRSTVERDHDTRLAAPERDGLWKRILGTEPMPCLPNHPVYGDQVKVRYFVYEVVSGRVRLDRRLFDGREFARETGRGTFRRRTRPTGPGTGSARSRRRSDDAA